jgi:hypothetical protein
MHYRLGEAFCWLPARCSDFWLGGKYTVFNARSEASFRAFSHEVDFPDIFSVLELKRDAAKDHLAATIKGIVIYAKLMNLLEKCCRFF